MKPESFKLSRYPETLAVVRLGPGTEVPKWAESSSLFSITATATETSIVCAARSVPTKSVHRRPFTAFEVEGPLDFALTGVLAELLAPLAAAEISVFTLSTFDTDWILIPGDKADQAAEEWTKIVQKLGIDKQKAQYKNFVDGARSLGYKI